MNVVAIAGVAETRVTASKVQDSRLSGKMQKWLVQKAPVAPTTYSQSDHFLRCQGNVFPASVVILDTIFVFCAAGSVSSSLKMKLVDVMTIYL